MGVHNHLDNYGVAQKEVELSSEQIIDNQTVVWMETTNKWWDNDFWDRRPLGGMKLDKFMNDPE